MATINQLSAVDSLQGGDQIPVYDASNGDARKASITTLLNFFEQNFTDPDFDTIIVAPDSNGFIVGTGNTGNSTWLIVNPDANYGIGTITLPPETSSVNNQDIFIVCTKSVGSLTISSVGATVTGAPTEINGYGAIRFRYNETQSTWYMLDTAGTETTSFLTESFTGDGVATQFTVTVAGSISLSSLQVFIDGIYQKPVSSYTLSGLGNLNIDFSEAPPVNSEIDIVIL